MASHARLWTFLTIWLVIRGAVTCVSDLTSLELEDAKHQCQQWISHVDMKAMFRNASEHMACPCIEPLIQYDINFQKHDLCYEELFFQDGVKRLCCYSDNGMLNSRGKDGGYVIVEKYKARMKRFHDMCCLTKETCDLFYDTLPLEDCEHYQIPTVVNSFGDAHIQPVSGETYDFNGLGEYVYLDVNNGTFKIQCRLEYLSPNNNDSTIFTAFALKAKDGTSWQVNLNRTSSGLLYDPKPASFIVIPSEGSLKLKSRSRAFNFPMITFSGGEDLQISFETSRRSIFACPSTVVKGLSGNITGGYEFQNGTIASETTNVRVIHEFGQSWKLANVTESVFNYSGGGNFTFYNRDVPKPRFPEDYLNDTTNMFTIFGNHSETEIQAYLNLCNVNDIVIKNRCLLSIARTNKINDSNDVITKYNETLNKTWILNYGNDKEPQFKLKFPSDIRLTLNVNTAFVLEVSKYVHDNDTNDTLTYEVTTAGNITITIDTNNGNLTLDVDRNLRNYNGTILVSVKDQWGKSDRQSLHIQFCGCERSSQCSPFTGVNSDTSLTSVQQTECTCGKYFEGSFCEIKLDVCNVTKCYSNVTCDNKTNIVNDSTNPCGPCPTGYRGDGINCRDINECSTKTSNCQQLCNNTVGSYTCSCVQGYAQNGSKCQDIDECEQLDKCKNDSNTECVNTQGSFSCFCIDDYSRDSSNNCVFDTGRFVYIGQVNLSLSACDENVKLQEKSLKTQLRLLRPINDKDFANVQLINTTYINGSDSTRVNVMFGLHTHKDLTWAHVQSQLNGNIQWNITTNLGKNCKAVGNKYLFNETENMLCKTLNQAKCDAIKSDCEQRDGMSHCVCKDGYKHKGSVTTDICDDVDECKVGGFECSNNGTCRNTNGNWTCDCPTGYKSRYWNYTTITCEDLDECSDNTTYFCQNGACNNTIGGWDCICNTGYSLGKTLGNSKLCDDIDECITGNSTYFEQYCVHGSCDNTVGSWNCSCPKERQWMKFDDGTYRCQGNFSYFGQIVINTTSTKFLSEDVLHEYVDKVVHARLVESNSSIQYLFVSSAIYELSNQSYTSIGSSVVGSIYTANVVLRFGDRIGDIDLLTAVLNVTDLHYTHISNDTIPINVTIRIYTDTDNVICKIPFGIKCDLDTTLCQSSDGEYKCSCKEGYKHKRSFGNQFSCEDINECTEGFNCSNNGTCRNTIGNWTCDCPEGFTTRYLSDKNITCEDLDECLDSSKYICRDGTCNNTFGNWECQCNNGYQDDFTHGNTRLCKDIDECTDYNRTYFDDHCVHGTCSNAIGSWNCTCPHNKTLMLFDDDIHRCQGNFSYFGQIEMLSTSNLSADSLNGCVETLVHDIIKSKSPLYLLYVSCSIYESSTSNRSSVDGSVYNAKFVLRFGDPIGNINLLTSALNVTDMTYTSISNVTTLKNVTIQISTDKDNVICKEPFENQCDLNTTRCQSEEGEYTCVCNPGYSNSSGAKYSCEDVNECLDNSTYPCLDGTCNNTIGSWECHCNNGYERNDTNTCKDVDECKAHNSTYFKHHCIHGNCSNTNGSWNCTCPGERKWMVFDDDMHRCQGNYSYFGQIEINTSPVTIVSRHMLKDYFDKLMLYRLKKYNQNVNVRDLEEEPTLYQLFVSSNIYETYNNSYTPKTSSVDSITYTAKFVLRFGELIGDISVLKDALLTADTNDITALNGTIPRSVTISLFNDTDNVICKAPFGNRCGLNTTTCESSNGTYSCSCKEGYDRSAGDPYRCEDVDECNTDGFDCSDNGNCSNTLGNWTCECPTGFVTKYSNYSSIICEDVDECDTNVFRCSNNGACKNTIGNWTCECTEGFSTRYWDFNNTTCEDVDECEVEGFHCSNNGNCSNTIGNWTCDCPPGFTTRYSSYNDITCEDLDECRDDSTYSCLHGTCNNTFGSWDCKCNSGYKEIRNTNTCIDIDECTSNDNTYFKQHCVYGDCSNTDGSWNCTCPDERQWMFFGDDMHRCQGNYSYFGQIEINTISVTIVSRKMLNDYLDTLVHSRLRQYEPQQHDALNGIVTDHTQLTKLNQLFVSSVIYDTFNSSYTLSNSSVVGTTYIAKFVLRFGDPISNMSNLIDAITTEITDNSTALNGTIPMHVSLQVANDKDNVICKEPFGNGCDSNTTVCKSSNGTYQCSCRKGYMSAGEKYSCEDIDECLGESGYVCKNGTCLNLSGSWRCQCETGYEESVMHDTFRLCKDIDECSNSVIHNSCTSTSGTCINTPGNWECACEGGYKTSYYNYENITCEDIDECKVNESCFHGTCINNDGGFECECPEDLGTKVKNDSTGFITCIGSHHYESNITMSLTEPLNETDKIRIATGLEFQIRTIYKGKFGDVSVIVTVTIEASINGNSSPVRKRRGAQSYEYRADTNTYLSKRKDDAEMSKVLQDENAVGLLTGAIQNATHNSMVKDKPLHISEVSTVLSQTACNCQNGGNCSQNGKDKTCSCPKSYEGVYCEVKVVKQSEDSTNDTILYSSVGSLGGLVLVLIVVIVVVCRRASIKRQKAKDVMYMDRTSSKDNTVTMYRGSLYLPAEEMTTVFDNRTSKRYSIPRIDPYDVTEPTPDYGPPQTLVKPEYHRPGSPKPDYHTKRPGSPRPDYQRSGSPTMRRSRDERLLRTSDSSRDSGMDISRGSIRMGRHSRNHSADNVLYAQVDRRPLRVMSQHM